jgi:hypothetical protein
VFSFELWDEDAASREGRQTAGGRGIFLLSEKTGPELILSLSEGREKNGCYPIIALPDNNKMILYYKLLKSIV